MTARYTLWLMPPPEAGERFARLIERLSRRLGTPCFVPHLTLCSAADLDESVAVTRARAAARHLAPVPVHLTGLSTGDSYFRCVYVLAERTEALLAAHRAACAHFGVDPAADYLPHLSLVYGDLAREEKERLVDEIGRRFDTRFTADRIALCAPAGPPQGWRLLGPYALEGRSAGER
ncbi:MAG TPA: 2'-5' RNA ligase family protein [Burkholderiales bacterium]